MTIIPKRRLINTLLVFTSSFFATATTQRQRRPSPFVTATDTSEREQPRLRQLFYPLLRNDDDYVNDDQRTASSTVVVDAIGEGDDHQPQEQYTPPSTTATIGLGYGLTVEPLFPSSNNPTMSPALQTEEPSYSVGKSYHDSIIVEAPNIISPTNYPIVTPPNLIWNINPSSPANEKEEEEEVHHFFATPSSATSKLNVDVEHTGKDIDFGDYLDNFNEENGNTYGHPCDTSKDGGGDDSKRSRSSGVSFDLLSLM